MPHSHQHTRTPLGLGEHMLQLEPAVLLVAMGLLDGLRYWNYINTTTEGAASRYWQNTKQCRSRTG